MSKFIYQPRPRRRPRVPALWAGALLLAGLTGWYTWSRLNGAEVSGTSTGLVDVLAYAGIAIFSAELGYFVYLAYVTRAWRAQRARVRTADQARFPIAMTRPGQGPDDSTALACPRCAHAVSIDRANCPWCGAALAISALQRLAVQPESSSSDGAAYSSTIDRGTTHGRATEISAPEAGMPLGTNVGDRSGTSLDVESGTNVLVRSGAYHQGGAWTNPDARNGTPLDARNGASLNDRSEANLVTRNGTHRTHLTASNRDNSTESTASNSTESILDDLFDASLISVKHAQATGVPIQEATYVAVGGGLGSFVWVDALRVCGARTDQIQVIGPDPAPYARFRQLCRASQIGDQDGLRSNSEACPDNLWGWPGYGVREIWGQLRRLHVATALGVAWQLLAEPTFATTYVPRAGALYAAIDRETKRIGWASMWRAGWVKAIRRTDDGRYVLRYTYVGAHGTREDRLVLAHYVHLSLGYPAIRLLSPVQDYRAQTGDLLGVVNAYEPHDHLYQQLRAHGGTVVIQGRGIVATRILERLAEERAYQPNIAVLHLMRDPRPAGQAWGRARRQVARHWELQPFNWPKASWGGELRLDLELASPAERERMHQAWGDSTTVPDPKYQALVEEGMRTGWYQVRFGAVHSIRRAPDGRPVARVAGFGPLADAAELPATFVLDATGLEVNPDENPLLADLARRYWLERNPGGGLALSDDFELAALRQNHGAVFASGVLTRGGHYGPVDSFLGLQYAALRSVDQLVASRAPGLKELEEIRSLSQWLKWALGRQP